MKWFQSESPPPTWSQTCLHKNLKQKTHEIFSVKKNGTTWDSLNRPTAAPSCWWRMLRKQTLLDAVACCCCRTAAGLTVGKSNKLTFRCNLKYKHKFEHSQNIKRKLECWEGSRECFLHVAPCSWTWTAAAFLAKLLKENCKENLNSIFQEWMWSTCTYMWTQKHIEKAQALDAIEGEITSWGQK